MKNKIIFFLIYFLLNSFNLHADEYQFDVSKLEVKEKGNIIFGYKGKLFSNKKNLEIMAEKFIYNKNENTLVSFNGEASLIEENLNIKFDILNIKNNTILTANNGIKINDTKNSLNIESENIILDRANNILTANNGIKINDTKNSLNIESENIILDRANNILTANNGIKINDTKNSLNIESENIILDRANNILTANNGIKINDTKNSLNIESENIILDRANNILKSNTDTVLKDKYDNSFKSKKFKYHIKDKRIFIFDATLKDFENNIFNFKNAKIDLKEETLNGEKIFISLNNKFLNPENEPRLSGDNVTYEGNITKIQKGVFTICKQTDKCPPWELTADEVTHNRNKK